MSRENELGRDAVIKNLCALSLSSHNSFLISQIGERKPEILGAGSHILEMEDIIGHRETDPGRPSIQGLRDEN